MAPYRLEKRRQPVTFTFVMVTNIVNLKRAVAAVGAALLLSSTAMGEVAPPALMEKLRNAPAGEARRIAREVETVWARSGSPAMDLLLQRGKDALQAEDYKLAVEHFTALTDHAPDFAEGYHQRAIAYYRRDLYGPALDDLEMALSLNPQNYNAIFGLAVMLTEFGDQRRAEQLFRQTLALHPNHENAQTALDALKRDGIGREL